VDRIVVPEIRLQARVGVGEEERATAQEILVDVELFLDLAPAGRSDDLAATVDYERVCELVDEVARSRPFRLIEAIAEAVMAAVLERFEVDEALVRVRKPGALRAWGVPYAAIEVRRRCDG